MYVSFLFLIVQHVGIDAGFERRIKHEPVEKIISIACLAEPYVSPHQPEFLQVVADGPFTHPHPAGQFRTDAGNFPAAIKVTAEYFPKKDRAYATSIFNAGASIGALIAPLTIPILAKMFGWEMAFIVIGGLGFIWMGFWVFMYDAPSKSKHVNQAELDYIEQDNREAGSAPMTDEKDEKRMKFWQCFSYKQTWAFVFGKFMTDGVWWFFLFWTPSYLNTQFGIKTSDPLGMALIFTLYAVTMLSIYGGSSFSGLRLI